MVLVRKLKQTLRSSTNEIWESIYKVSRKGRSISRESFGTFPIDVLDIYMPEMHVKELYTAANA